MRNPSTGIFKAPHMGVQAGRTRAQPEITEGPVAVSQGPAEMQKRDML